MKHLAAYGYRVVEMNRPDPSALPQGDDLSDFEFSRYKMIVHSPPTGYTFNAMKKFDLDYDMVIIGGGHAGAEAAWAGAAMGLRVALVTLALDKIGEMSCNPAIGGLAKGHIVCEVDALGGLMGLAIDATGIQFRMLNRSKGPAVWGPRAQADKVKYRQWIRSALEAHKNIDLIEGEVKQLLIENGQLVGLILADGRAVRTSSAVITTGTFMNGVIHIGDKQYGAGRIGEAPSVGLSDSLRQLGFRVDRLKTGTCPRLAKDSIDYDACELQEGDDPPEPFSFMTDSVQRPQTPCHITYTNERTHDILRTNLHRAPLYPGQIQTTGPRYCPSVELKITRFPDKNRHQLFLEPESLENDWIYCNGLATSVPIDVQEAMVHSIVGLEHAKILQYGYAIEYDFLPPDQLTNTLQSKLVQGLYFAGQINGTSGYEEAAGQGILAGINAAQTLRGKEPITFSRDQAYIGVLVDDLVTKGVDEPYRMFTSRAEYRLLLRADTAARRLTPIGREVGLVDDERWARFEDRQQQAQRFRAQLQQLKCDGASVEAMLKRPETTWAMIIEQFGADAFANYGPRVIRQVTTDIKYEGYERREQSRARRLDDLERVRLPEAVDYLAIDGLRRESQEKLQRYQPATLGQASRIIGVTPADVMVLMVHLNKASRSPFKQ